MGTTANRIVSIDALRVIVILFMIMGHTSPFESPPLSIGKELDLATVLNQAIRFIIPFFFVLAGYFWGMKVRTSGDAWGSTRPLLARFTFLFFAWSLIYLLPFNIVETFKFGELGPLKRIYWNIVYAFEHPLKSLAEGTMGHLWFLMAMVCVLLIAAALLSRRMERTLLALGVVLYVVGLSGGAYSLTPLGFESELQTRDGPFFSLLFFAIGHKLQQFKPQRSWFWGGLLMTLVGGLMQYAELSFLHEGWGASWQQEYVFSTALYGVGVALVALSDPPFLRLPRIAALGPLVVGIYCSHYIFVQALWPLERLWGGNPLWDIGFVLVVFLLSLGLTALMHQHPRTRRLVSSRAEPQRRPAAKAVHTGGGDLPAEGSSQPASGR